MKTKSISFLAALLCLIYGIHGQGYNPQLDSIKARYQFLDSNYITTGTLYDRFPLSGLGDSIYHAHPKNYQGLPATDSLSSFSIGKNLLRDLLIASYHPKIIPNGSNINQEMRQIEANGNIPLAVTSILYQHMHPQAIKDGWVTIDTNTSYLYNAVDSLHIQDTIYDNQGQVVGIVDTVIYQNADSLATLAFPVHYTTTAFTSVGVVPYDLNTPLTFKLPNNLFVTNRPPPSSMHINLGNGSGWQKLSTGTPITASYPLHGVVTVKVRLDYNEGDAPYEARFKLNLIEKAPDPHDQIIFSNLPTNTSCQISDNGYGTGNGIISIKYHDENIRVLRKPIILVEGFDSNYGTDIDDSNPDQNRYRSLFKGYGSINWNGISTGKFYNSDYQQVFSWMDQFPVMLDSLTAAGYDIVFIDYKTNRERIQKNANMLIKVIQWVNDQKTTDEEIVVMGASMGGLIARYALAKMEADGCCHQTRMMVIADSPQKGANIPLSVQSFVREAWKNYMSDDAKYNFNYVLKSEAARQMVIYHLEGPQTIRDNFVAELDSLGFPQNTYNIAVVNGRGDGIGLNYGPGDVLLKWEQDWLVPSSFIPCFPSGLSGLTIFQQIAYATPNSPTQPSGAVMLRTKPLGNTLFNYGLLWGFTAGHKYVCATLLPGTAAVISAACPLCAPIVWPLLPVAQGVNSMIFSGLNTAIINDNNNSLQNNKYFNRPTLPYDNSPGGMSNTMKSIADGAPSWLFGILHVGKTKHGPNAANHSFVPTISGLVLPDSIGLFDNLFNLPEAPSYYSPFDKVYIPQSDPPAPQYHVQLTPGNIGFMISELRQNDPKAQGQTQGAELKVSNGTYNLGEEARQILTSATIYSGGNLYINGYRPLYYGVGTSYTQAGSYFEGRTNDACGSHVLVKNGGEFIIGDNNTPSNNFANMLFKDLGVLEIEAGGTLTVYQNSRLLIESGAELIIHPGAIINLAGTNAVLELQGKLTIKENAVFSPTGPGFVRFNQTGLTPADWPTLLNYEANAQMHFTGTGMNDKRVEVAMNTPIYKNLDSLIFTNCRVEIAESVFFGIHSSLSSTGSHFTSIDSLRPATGLRLYGQKYVSINQSRFSYSVEALRGNLLTYGHPLSISNSEFDHNTIGLKFIGKNFNLTNGDLHDNLTGLTAENIDGVSWVKNSDFLDNIGKAIAVVGQHGSILKVSGSNIDNSDKGAFTEGTVLQAWCNSWQNNDVAIQAEEGEILMGKPQGHNNSFSGNRLDMYFFELDRLRFVNGYNSLSGWYRYMVGTFSGNATNYLHYNSTTTGYELNVKNNNLPTVGGTMVPVDLSLNQQQVGLHNWGPPSLAITPCQSAGPSLPGITDCCFKTSFTLPISGLGTLPLDSAVLVAASHLDDGDLTTIDYLKEILEYVSDNGYCYPGMEDCHGYTMTDLDVLILRDAYQYYLTALSNAYRNGLIELNRANPAGEQSEYLSFFIDETNHRLVNEVPNVGVTEDLEFYYNISKAHAYRMGEHYNEALAILDSHELWSTSREMAQSSYWQCVCDAENALILEELSPDNFAYNLESCRTNLLAKKERYIPNFGGVEVELNRETRFEALLAPNPSNGSTNLVFAEPTQSGTYAVYAIDGKLVARGTIAKGVTEKELALNLPAGYYTVKVRINTNEKTLKWIVK